MTKEKPSYAELEKRIAELEAERETERRETNQQIQAPKVLQDNHYGHGSSCRTRGYW